MFSKSCNLEDHGTSRLNFVMLVTIRYSCRCKQIVPIFSISYYKGFWDKSKCEQLLKTTWPISEECIGIQGCLKKIRNLHIDVKRSWALENEGLKLLMLHNETITSPQTHLGIQLLPLFSLSFFPSIVFRVNSMNTIKPM